MIEFNLNKITYPLLFKMQKKLTDTVKLGDFVLKNRVVLSALTRTRCNPQDGVPTDLVRQYYTQRSGAGLLLTQCSAWCPRGHAYPGAGNFYNKDQYQGWRKVVQAVHKNGSKIFLQLFHSGRATHQSINGGHQVWGPSPLPIRDNIPFLNIPYPTPKQMTIQDIKQSQESFRKAVIAAKEVGFDGIQIHGANGYLVDQFLKSETNVRKDEYGGSPEKRIRYCLELIDICLEYLKPYQVGIKLSPVSQFGDMYDLNPIETFSLLLKQLSKKNIGFVQLRESTQFGLNKKGSGKKTYYEKSPPQQMDVVCKILRPSFKGLMIANDSFTPEKATQFLNNGWADLVSFGRLYISNPDLAERISKGQQLNDKWDFHTFFSPLNPKGYTDYPFYEQWKKLQQNPIKPSV